MHPFVVIFASRSCFTEISVCFALSLELWWGLVWQHVWRLHSIALPLSDIKERHTNALTHTQAMGCTCACLPLSIFPKEKKDNRIESGLKWKLEGPRESQSETHINIHTHRGISCEPNGSELGGVYCPYALSLKWGTGRMYRPQRGARLHPPHRLAEGSGPSRAHNTEKRMELPNWAAFSPHTFFTHTRVDIWWEKGCLGQTELTILDLMSAMF